MTSGELAKLLGVTDQTIRNWSDAWGDFLSDSATPPEVSGSPRAVRDYTGDDMEVLALVADYRRRNRPLDEIREALEQGQRGQVIGSGDASPTFDGLDYPPVPVLVAELHQYRGELKATQQERDRLLSDLDKERQRVEFEHQARLEAEKRASRAEGQLEVWQSLREQPQERPAEPPAAPQQPIEQRAIVVPEEPLQRRSWWSRLLGK